MTNNNLSVVIMHMLQGRAEEQVECLNEQICALKQMRNEVNSPLAKAEINHFVDSLVRRSQGMESVANAFYEYTEEEWAHFIQDVNAFYTTNSDAYDEICKLCTIGGNTAWMADMWQ